MEKKFEDEELDKLIDEQFIKEAQMMEEALFSDDDFEDYEASDEEVKASYQKLVGRLKADGIYREDINAASAADVPAAADKAVPISKKRNFAIHRKFARVAGFVVVCGICIFAVSMTSEANRNYFVESIKILVGDDTGIVIDNDAENENVSTDEYGARADIEEKLNVELPRFLYRPDTFEFYSYEVDSFAQIARLEYKYNGNVLLLYISKGNENVASLIESIHGDESETITMLYEDINVEVQEIVGEEDDFPSYVAQWDREEVIYNLTGRIELKELEKVISKIRY